MKYTLIAALLGAATADDVTPVWNLQSTHDYRSDSTLQKDYGDHSTTQADARPPLRSHLMTIAEAMENIERAKNNKHKKAAKKTKKARKQKKVREEDPEEEENDLQMHDDDEEVDHSGEFFKAGEHDMLGDGGYKRVTTPRFSADNDDIFMRSMVEQYSLEGKNKDGSPNGQFWMDEANAKSASSEVLHTHRQLTGKARDEYLATYFPRTWAHFDVNKSGKIESIKMPQFMRFLCSDQQMFLW
jgi:hypothetical protein